MVDPSGRRHDRVAVAPTNRLCRHVAFWESVKVPQDHVGRRDGRDEGEENMVENSCVGKREFGGKTRERTPIPL